MRQTLRKFLKILDGQPTRRRGQSLVEMALTTPLLVMMVLGLAEVGFLANNYLILMDAVRSGGRVAVNLEPVNWIYGQARNRQRLDCDTDPKWYTMLIGSVNTEQPGVRNADDILDGGGAVVNPADPPRASTGDFLNPSPPYAYSTDTTTDPEFGFFDEVACQTIYAMSPLRLNDLEDATNKDDVVVSALSYQLMEYTTDTTTGNPKITWAPVAGKPLVVSAQNRGNTWVTVTGRWPLENRFCGSVDGTGAFLSGDSRDPFDYLITDFGFTTGAASGPTNPHRSSQKLTEGIAYEANGTFHANPTEWIYVLNPQTPSHNQHVRGYVFSGKNKNTDPGVDDCYGSRFRVQDIEERLNLDSDFNKDVPNGGLVIVEIFWQHHPLFYGPIFRGFSNDRTKDPVLHVWGMFPVPAVEATATPS